MKKEEKQLLIKDLSARLPYGVKANIPLVDSDERIYTVSFNDMKDFVEGNIDINSYLRPMSSMTEEERKEYELLANHCIVTSIGFIHLEAAPLIDWLNAHHFDYRNLVEKGLAIAVTEENNPYKD